RLPAQKPGAALLAAIVALAFLPGWRTSAGDHHPTVPATLRALKNYAAGRPLVVEIADPYLGPEVTGLLYWAHRDGFRACLTDPKGQFICTHDSLCTPPGGADGAG